MNDALAQALEAIIEEAVAAEFAKHKHEEDNETQPPEHLWTSDEAARILRKHPGTIRRLCREGEIHAYQPMKRGHWLIEDQCLIAYKTGEPCVHR